MQFRTIFLLLRFLNETFISFFLIFAIRLATEKMLFVTANWNFLAVCMSSLCFSTLILSIVRSHSVFDFKTQSARTEFFSPVVAWHVKCERMAARERENGEIVH